jgi:hypothetical protein
LIYLEGQNGQGGSMYLILFMIALFFTAYVPTKNYNDKIKLIKQKEFLELKESIIKEYRQR